MGPSITSAVKTVTGTSTAAFAISIVMAPCAVGFEKCDSRDGLDEIRELRSDHALPPIMSIVRPSPAIIVENSRPGLTVR